MFYAISYLPGNLTEESYSSGPPPRNRSETITLRGTVKALVTRAITTVLRSVALMFPVTAAVASPFAYIASAGITLVDTATQSIVGSPISVGDSPIGVAVSPNGQYVYVANATLGPYPGLDGSVSVISTATNTVTATVAVGRYPTGIAVSPDGRSVYVTNEGEGSISIIDAATNAVVRTIGGFAEAEGIVFAPNGRYAYVASSYSGFVAVLDTGTGTVVAKIAVGASPTGVAVTPNGKVLYVSNNGDGTVSVIDTTANAVVATISAGGTPWGIATSPDGKYAYVASRGAQALTMIDTATNTVIGSLPVGSSPVGVAVTSDGQSVYVTNNGEGTVTIIDVRTRTVAKVLKMPGAASFGNFIGPIVASALENPQPGSFQSGIGLLSGWSCIGGALGVSIDGKSPYPVQYGAARSDTASVCGSANTNTGFGLLLNFNLLGAGQHTAQLIVNGLPQGAATPFTVSVPAGEFLSGASKELTVTDFPTPGKSTTLTWQQSQQNFAIKSVSP